ncbi:ABC transporter ATP-binding protein [Paraburkholderia panacisoli]|uniref:ABC transporter ATP-binding protein n=1 Tax=Paraburkholderia panacisoli TaxID=2603818 RepID=A0A5B0HH68_9BURK|nr:ABC transporter ATP-binding protein [Paraburkholderia panacisoli]KAA1014541.1 ABC transporter ATP-binding protein [Paraburkholderia panacisoli]
MSLLDVQELEVRYGKAVALEGVSLRVETNELVGVLGSNGAGKTTLLKAISRVLPSTGMLRFNGKALIGVPAHKVVAQGICHCPEGRRLFPELTAEKNLRLGAYLRTDRGSIDADLQLVYSLFPALRERRSQLAGTLSGGEQQMVAIGRALMGRPRLLMLDEPSVGLAGRLKAAIFDAIDEIRHNGTAVLLVEQDAHATFGIADRVYVLEQGRVAREGPGQELLEDGDIRRIYLGL